MSGKRAINRGKRRARAGELQRRGYDDAPAAAGQGAHAPTAAAVADAEHELPPGKIAAMNAASISAMAVGAHAIAWVRLGVSTDLEIPGLPLTNASAMPMGGALAAFARVPGAELDRVRLEIERLVTARSRQTLRRYAAHLMTAEEPKS